MYSKQEENLILYQKAKHKITMRFIIYFTILCIYFYQWHICFQIWIF